jgi:hypothetical protein
MKNRIYKMSLPVEAADRKMSLLQEAIHKVPLLGTVRKTITHPALVYGGKSRVP